jgi:hypothetical protein
MKFILELERNFGDSHDSPFVSDATDIGSLQSSSSTLCEVREKIRNLELQTRVKLCWRDELCEDRGQNTDTPFSSLVVLQTL